jgi:hypothetical protein
VASDRCHIGVTVEAGCIVRGAQRLWGVTPSEIASRLGIGKAACIECWVSRRRWRRESNAQRVQGFGSSGVPQLFGFRLIDMP